MLVDREGERKKKKEKRTHLKLACKRQEKYSIQYNTEAKIAEIEAEMKRICTKERKGLRLRQRVMMKKEAMSMRQ